MNWIRENLDWLIFLAGFGQLAVLSASALVPIRLKWTESFRSLPRLHRQLFWIYGGYIVLAIIAFGLLSLFQSRALAGGSDLAPALCAYIAAFWGIRLALQMILDVKDHLSTWWLKLGYCLLTLFFAFFTFVFSFAAL
ncbi:MAG TPA: hypothetical protein VKE98_07135 [Gemmataceae bacterium]|nr:hypothetical protein [Gemmataceae bacterium]